MNQLAEKIKILIPKRLIEAQAASQSGFSGLWGPASEYCIHRVSRRDTQEQKDQAGNQPKHEWREGESGCAIAEKLPSSCH